MLGGLGIFLELKHDRNGIGGAEIPKIMHLGPKCRFGPSGYKTMPFWCIRVFYFIFKLKVQLKRTLFWIS